MDLQYLLWLQDFRNSTGNVLTPFMEFISHFAITYLILLLVFIFCWLGILYITVKPYPMDLNAEGKLIVDPQKMMNDGYGDIGKAIGFVTARFVEKKWIRFRPLKKSWFSVLFCLIGLIPIVLLKTWLRPVLTDAFGPHWGRLVFSVFHVFYFVAFFPGILKLIEIRQRSKEKAGIKEA